MKTLARKNLGKHKGVSTWNFSQADISAWRHYFSAGICAALSAQWIIDHAKGDSLYNSVVDKSGRLIGSEIRKIAKVHFDCKVGNQDEQIARYMQDAGMRERETSSMKKAAVIRGGSLEVVKVPERNPTLQESQGPAVINVAKELGAALEKVNGYYVQIDFGGAKYAHATAAWIGDDACFFDPNTGEFYFGREKTEKTPGVGKARFIGWFEEYYASMYQGFPFRMNRKWSVKQWGLGVHKSK